MCQIPKVCFILLSTKISSATFDKIFCFSLTADPHLQKEVSTFLFYKNVLWSYVPNTEQGTQKPPY